MKINFVRLMNFRNVDFADIPLGELSIWVCGANAQGKTNLLEALGLLSAARSFRTQKLSSLVRFGQNSAKIIFGVEREGSGESEIEMTIGPAGRKISVDGEEMKKLGDYIGKFPAVAMCSDDIKILRGSPENRRRDLDIFISSLDSEYFSALRKYHSCLAQRNALLKDARNGEDLFLPFERQMAEAAEILERKRAEFLSLLSEIASKKYSALAGENGDSASICLKSSCGAPDAATFLAMLKSGRAEDFSFRSTLKGPHRDDFAIHIDSKDARLYASEGQQRSAVLAIKLAQFQIFKEKSGISPALLCDDILGELDSMRREAFWKCVDAETQVVATSTCPPPSTSQGRKWKSIFVSGGGFSQEAPGERIL